MKVRGRRTEESRKKFQAIANDLADESDAQVQIEGKDGQIRDGDAILRTRMPFHLPHEGSNLLEFDNVADQLQEVYTRFVKDGKIKDGTNVVMTAAGIGYAWAANVVKWGPA